MDAPTDNLFKFEQSIVTHEFGGDQRCISIGIKNGRRIARKSGYSATELDIMNLISSKPHPNLIQLIEVDLNEECLVMEGIKDGLTLHRYCSRIHITSFTIGRVVEMMMQLASGLDYLHQLNVIHHDLNHDNVLVSFPDHETDESDRGPCLKICDFGMSEVADVDGLGRNENRGSGTGHWRAPEQLNDQSPHPVSTRIDIYPMGLIGSRLLYHGRTVDENHFSLPLALVDLIELCMNENPYERPTASHLTVILSKPSIITGPTMADMVIKLYRKALTTGHPIPSDLEKMLERVASALGVDLETVKLPAE